jgi:hypothetical protein
MTIHTIDAAEKARLTDSSCHLFIARNPDFYPCQANSERLISFVHSQLGQTLDEYAFPVTVDMWQAAYEHIKKTSWFYERPVEEEVEDPAVVREREAQQAVRDNHDAQQRAAKIARDKAMPLSELSKVVGVQNAQFREQRDLNNLPVRQPGTEPQSISQRTMGIRAQARINVATANPSLARDGAEFSRLCAAEISRLRSE